MGVLNERERKCFVLKLPGRVLLLFVALALATSALCAQSWKFIVYGDTRKNDDKHRLVLQAMKEYTPDYKFIISTGDLVTRDTLTDQWDAWQAAVNEVLGGTGQNEEPPKYMAVPGNHDRVPGKREKNWAKYLPGQQRYGNRGGYFFFDYQDARFIILDCADSTSDNQKTMLVDALKGQPKKWLFAFWHKPIFDFGPKKYDAKIHRKWGVPLYDHGCDIIFNGHAHYYARTKKLQLNGTKNPPVDTLRGTVECVTGNGGAPLHAFDFEKSDNQYMLEKNISEYGYTECTVDSNQVTLRHILTDGRVFDEAAFAPNPKPGTGSQEAEEKVR